MLTDTKQSKAKASIFYTPVLKKRDVLWCGAKLLRAFVVAIAILYTYRSYFHSDHLIIISDIYKNAYL